MTPPHTQAETHCILAPHLASTLLAKNLQILRLGVYELTHQALPAHALNTHVELAKAWVRPSAGALANGVLRACARRRDGGTLPDALTEMRGSGTRNAARRLSVALSHPTWMVARWVSQLGEEQTRALLEANNRRAHAVGQCWAPLMDGKGA
jgi:16S rRNA (cytosine967-C5)-methyltransferase